MTSLKTLNGNGNGTNKRGNLNIEEKVELNGDTKIQKTKTTTIDTTLEEFKSINKNTEKIEENDSTDEKLRGSLIPPWFR